MHPVERDDRAIQPSPDLIRFAERSLATANLSCKEIAGDGSSRLFYRVKGKGGSWIVMINNQPPQDERGVTENDSFLYIDRHLKGRGVPVPEIFQYDQERGWFLLEDLGDCHLQTEVISIKEDRKKLVETYQRVIDTLIVIQTEGSRGFDPCLTHNPPYDAQFMLTWESGYFLRAFLNGFLGLDIPDEELREELAELACRAAEAPGGYFLYRDFQSRNIMVQSEGLGFLDFQGGRLGPLQYDLASLLLDPYVELDHDVQEELFTYYLSQIAKRTGVGLKGFQEHYPFVALHRAMQILGAFGFLTRVRGLAFFLPYIPAAIQGLQTLLQERCFNPYKKLKKICLEEIKGI